MDYEKKYKEALVRVKESMKDGGISSNTIAYLESIFPELAESEDERIRKWIRKELESKYVVDNIVNNVMADKALDWLEKQGKYKQVEVRPFNTVFSQEQIDEIDKRIEKEIKLYNAKLMDAQMRAKDFPMTD